MLRHAPDGYHFLCAACGKTAKDRFAAPGGWDESCSLNAILLPESYDGSGPEPRFRVVCEIPPRPRDKDALGMGSTWLEEAFPMPKQVLEAMAHTREEAERLAVLFAEDARAMAERYGGTASAYTVEEKQS